MRKISLFDTFPFRFFSRLRWKMKIAAASDKLSDNGKLSSRNPIGNIDNTKNMEMDEAISETLIKR